MQRPTDGQGRNFPQGGMQPPTDGQGGNFSQGGMQRPAKGQGSQEQSNTQTDATSSATTPTDQQSSGRQAEGANRNFGGFMGGRGGNGGSLEYTTDEVSSYGSIFNNVVGKGSNSDFKRVVTALKALSEGEDLENYFDVDKILRYLAAHTIVVNLDSYSSSMAQNYYLYENNGKVTILPWDYNLAWGGFQSGSASSVINFPIDTPVSGVEMSSRPLIGKLFSNTEYLERYHDYLQELMTNYFADGKWEDKITQLDALISDYVKNDKTAFCTFDEYKKAVEAFKTLGNLRWSSIQGQLDGTVPSTTAEQAANPDKLISAGNLSLSPLGSMMGGGNRGGMGNRQTDGNNPQGGQGFDPGQTWNMADGELMMQAMRILQDAGGTVTDDAKAKLLELGLTEEQISMLSQIGRGMPQGAGGMPQGAGGTPQRAGGMPQGAGGTPQGAGGNMRNPAGNETKFSSDRSASTSPFGGRAISGAGTAGTTESLLIYSGLFGLVLLSTFFVAKKKRGY